MKPFQRQFWKFSWHEMGTIDVPEMIDYVLSETQEKDLHYIGHSQVEMEVKHSFNTV